VRVWFQNIGSADAGPFVVEVNSAQQTVASGLHAGQTDTLWFPECVYPGENTAFVDAAFQVTESNENNNQLSQLLPIPTLPPTCTPTSTPLAPD
jgi:subtilase family serine protease